MNDYIKFDGTVIDKNSIIKVSSTPSIITGISVFIIIMGLFFCFHFFVNNNESTNKYNSVGCQIDSTGNPISKSIYSNKKYDRNRLIGYNNCVKKTPPMLIFGIGFLFSITFSYIIGINVYNEELARKNPLIAADILERNIYNRKMNNYNNMNMNMNGTSIYF